MNISLLNQKYVPVRKLAEGGMGEIFLARQTGVAGFQREVVLKRLHRRLSENPRAAEMLLEEARLAAALSHPNIVQIYDIGEEDGAYFIVMERVLGASLRELAEATTRQGQMIPMELSLSIIAQVLEGLRYAHSFRDESGRPLKIVHRDIGPNNILISVDGAVKIADFGIARAETQLQTESGPRPGKFAYMSPEAVRGEPMDARADLFSTGVLLYELTVGQRLFRAASYQDLQRVVNEPIPPPTFARAGYPVDLEILVMRALERTPAERFGSAEEMLEALEEFAHDTGMRLSRLRLARFIGKVLGKSGAALEAAQEPREGSVPEAPAEDLDFDRGGMFGRGRGAEGSAPDAAGEGSAPEVVAEEASVPAAAPVRTETTAVREERVRRVREAVQQANEAIAELVAASDDDEAEEGRTVEIKAAVQVALRADSVEAEDDPAARQLRAEPALLVKRRAAGGTEAPAATSELEPAPALRDGSALIVTDELVEEELDLGDPGDNLIRERPLAQVATEPELEVPPAEGLSPEATPQMGSELPARERSSVTAQRLAPEASPDLLDALADISAELKAAAASDRRREEALAQMLESLGGDTEVPPPAPRAAPPAPTPPAAPLQAPPPLPALVASPAPAALPAAPTPAALVASPAPAALLTGRAPQTALPPASPPPASPAAASPPASPPPASPPPASPPPAASPAAASLLSPSSLPASPPSGIAAASDELEDADGGRRAPDDLELSDLRGARHREISVDEELELEADGDTIVLQPEEASVVEAVAPPPLPPASPPPPPAAASAPRPPAAPGKPAPEPQAAATPSDPPTARPAEPPPATTPDPAGGLAAEASAPGSDDDGLDAPTITETPEHKGKGKRRRRGGKRRR